MFWVQIKRTNKNTGKVSKINKVHFDTVLETVERYREYEMIISKYILNPSENTYEIICDPITKMYLELADHL